MLGISSPQAATSVVSNMAGAEGTARKDEDDVRAFVRAADRKRPWREKSTTTGEIGNESICACVRETARNWTEIRGPYGGLALLK